MSRKYRVMVVDDTAYIRFMLKRMIKDLKEFKVVEEASNGIEAVNKFKMIDVDIITMDITMPKMDGLDAIKEIISFDEDVKIVMISALGEKDKVLKAISYGAKNYILKPFKKRK